MTPVTKPRSHLVERAVEALGLVRPAGLAEAERAPPAVPEPALAGGARTAAPVQAPSVAAAPVPTPPLPQAAAEPELPPAPRPVIGEAVLRGAGLMVGLATAGRSRVSEEISLVQQQVMRTVATAEPAEGHCRRVILITSARPGEGKSFMALNLAASIAASSGAPTLLIDTDGKPNSVSELLGVKAAPGLRLLASQDGPVQPGALLMPTAHAGLSFLPFGAAIEGQAAAPLGAILATTIRRLAQALPDHVIVLDSSPCLSTSDPTGLSAVAGQVLMVVKAETTQRSELEAALELVEACPVLQLVLNRTRIAGSDSFGSYGAYGLPPKGRG